jgi:hypothetical protein
LLLSANMATSKRGVRESHPFKDICNPKKKLEEGQNINLCFEFVEKICKESCRDRLTGKRSARTCRCLSILQENAERQAAVAKYLANFIAKPQQERHSIIMEWQRYTLTTTAERCFYIPFISEKDDDEYPIGTGEDADEAKDEGDGNERNNNINEPTEHPLHALKEWMVCKDAISLLLDYGCVKWRTCKQAVLNNKLPEHGNKGKLLGNAKRFADEVKDDLHEFFAQIRQFATPRATRVVREETGSGLRDGEEELVELPTFWSKRGVYARFCSERGYVISCTARGNIVKTERSDPEWNVQNKKTICSWHAFLQFWDRNYPMIRLSSPAADICTDCHIFYNSQKYNNSTEGNSTTSSITIDDPMIAYVPDSLPTNLEYADTPDGEDNVDLQLDTNVEMLERESMLQKATLHVNQAMCQRKLANKKIQEAIDTRDLPHSQRQYTFIADFSQNMELPFFGESQPGDTYYFSALKINVFGIVDCSIFGGKLSVHVYHEGIAKKGGNNVASLLVNEFKRLGIIRDNERGKELTIVMDNCAGQNKNRMVLRLATYLVEAEYFEKVNFVFLVVGHTKNACDRWFNTLKRTYRRSNIYSFDQLTESMKTHKFINVTVSEASDFQDWDKFFNSIYKRPASGTTHKNHIFTAEKENKTLLHLRKDDLPGTQETTQDIMKKNTNNPERFALLRSPPLETLVPPGIPPIKQVELFSKYRSLLPEPFRDITCPDPGEDIKFKIKNERNTKQRDRKKSKIELGLEEVKKELAAKQIMEEATI